MTDDKRRSSVPHHHPDAISEYLCKTYAVASRNHPPTVAHARRRATRLDARRHGLHALLFALTAIRAEFHLSSAAAPAFTSIFFVVGGLLMLLLPETRGQELR